MENKQIPKREEKLWSEIKNYQVATNTKRNGDLLLVPFAKVEKVGEFIIVTE